MNFIVMSFQTHKADMSPKILKSKIETQSGQTIIPVFFFNSYGISPKTLDQPPVWWENI